MMAADQQIVQDQISAAHEVLTTLRAEVARYVVGQDRLVDRLIVALLMRGHILVEGVPGLAKTLVVKTLSGAIDGSFKRIQFTPDLLPADITGTLIFDPSGGSFNARLGPIFANLVLADEINRAPAKVQSALLEAMQERQVTIGDTSYPLPDPFVVMATQNPIEQEGTYSLPEAQVDRFLIKVLIDYPDREDEKRILSLYLNPSEPLPPVRPVVTLDALRTLARLASSVHVDERIERYIVELVNATRRPGDYRLPALTSQIGFGASPRATLAFAYVAKGHAFLQGRPFVIPEDIKDVAHDVLRHRLLLTYEAAAEKVTADQIIDQILHTIVVP